MVSPCASSVAATCSIRLPPAKASILVGVLNSPSSGAPAHADSTARLIAIALMADARMDDCGSHRLLEGASLWRSGRLVRLERAAPRQHPTIDIRSGRNARK